MNDRCSIDTYLICKKMFNKINAKIKTLQYPSIKPKKAYGPWPDILDSTTFVPKGHIQKLQL